jgi:hypothetical protein
MEKSTNEEPVQEHWRGKPFYTTYSFWILIAFIVALFIWTLDTSIKVYKLNYVMEYVWNATMNTSFYDMLRQVKPPIEDFIPFK